MNHIVKALIPLAAAAFAWTTSVQAQDKPWSIDEMLGNPTAPITIIEYASLTCPHCAEFAEKSLPQIKKEWIDTGKAKLIYRDFPTPPVPLAQAAAMVSHCSGNRYFAFVDTFYSTQDTWARSPTPLDSIKMIAKLGGMGPEQVDKCLSDQGLLNQINARMEEGQRKFEVESTPSFVIDGKLYAGEMSPEQFSKVLAGKAK